jgi:hypothetical protein
MTKNIMLYLFVIFIGYVLFNYKNLKLDSRVYVSPRFTESLENSIKQNQQNNLAQQDQFKLPDYQSNPSQMSSQQIKKQIEQWRDLPYIGNKDNITYHRTNLQNISRKNLPIYYPISSPLEDNYFNYLNSISSPKLSLFRNVLRQVEVYTNQQKAPIIFNYAERPVEIKKIDMGRIKVLAQTVIDLINKFASPIIRIEYVKTLNELHEETDEQSKINFDLKINLFYTDSENLGKPIKTDTMYIQPEFIFDKSYPVLVEDQFFKPNKPEFKMYLSKLIIVGSEHLGFLGGRYGVKKSRK